MHRSRLVLVALAAAVQLIAAFIPISFGADGSSITVDVAKGRQRGTDLGKSGVSIFQPLFGFTQSLSGRVSHVMGGGLG